MNVELSRKITDEIGHEKFQQFGIREEDFRWYHGINVDLRKLEPHQIEDFQKLLEKYSEIYGVKTCLKQIETFLAVLDGKMPKLVKVALFEPSLVQYLINTPRRWLYHKAEDMESQWVASRVIEIKYVPEVPATRERAGHPEYVDVHMVYDKLGSQRGFHDEFYAEDILRKSVPEILALKGYYIETDELRSDYLKNLKRYDEIISQIGRQFILNGIAINQVPDDVTDSYGEKVKEKIRDYVQNKVVIDVFIERSNEDTDRWSRHGYQQGHGNGGYFWERHEDLIKTLKKQKVVDRAEDPVVEIPIHPFVVIFDLQRHMRMSTHVVTLTDYVFDKKLSQKLVLPTDIKELINILIEHKAGGFKDIIRGKSGGAVILLTGQAGVGKTLTAEVFAESTEKALYSVQASQLGLDATELEKNLKIVLRRASRWGAVLLLDEADVYVHERGNDLQQNAIVGVFLRTLEYHSSIMFMTTNRPDIVDDAIASRCIARIDYKYPSEDEQKKIWRILADSADINLSDEMIDDFVNSYHSFSGRDIKNILKLANLKAVAENTKINMDHIKYVQKFNPTVVKQINETWLSEQACEKQIINSVNEDNK